VFLPKLDDCCVSIITRLDALQDIKLIRTYKKTARGSSKVVWQSSKTAKIKMLMHCKREIYAICASTFNLSIASYKMSKLAHVLNL